MRRSGEGRGGEGRDKGRGVRGRTKEKGWGITGRDKGRGVREGWEECVGEGLDGEMRVCVCVCARARVRACVHVCRGDWSE
jgi:hypothetical protein